MSMRPLSKMLNIRLSCSMYTPAIADVTSLGAVCLCVNSCSEHLGVRHVGRLFTPPTLCLSSFSFLLENILFLLSSSYNNLFKAIIAKLYVNI